MAGFWPLAVPVDAGLCDKPGHRLQPLWDESSLCQAWRLRLTFLTQFMQNNRDGLTSLEKVWASSETDICLRREL